MNTEWMNTDWLTFDPHVGCRNDREYQQKHDEHECLEIIGGDTLHAEQDGPEQSSLRCIEAVSQNICYAAIVRRYNDKRFTRDW